jgi:hypothetical protein
MHFTGVDSYVFQCLKDKEQKWLPDKTSCRIQNHKLAAIEMLEGGGDGGDDDTSIVLGMVHAGISEMKRELVSLGGRLTALEEKKEGDE